MAWTEAVQRLWAALSDHRPSLYPAEEWDELMDIKIARLAPDTAEAQNPEYVSAVKSGLHLWNDSLDKSHDLSQHINNPTGSYWHALMHRMEGDYDNANYWFRMAGGHPVYSALLPQARQACLESGIDSIDNAVLKDGLRKLSAALSWDPYSFTELVRHQVGVAQESRAEELLSDIQWIEIKLLLQYSLEQTGGTRIEL